MFDWVLNTPLDGKKIYLSDHVPAPIYSIYWKTRESSDGFNYLILLLKKWLVIKQHGKPGELFQSAISPVSTGKHENLRFYRV